MRRIVGCDSVFNRFIDDDLCGLEFIFQFIKLVIWAEDSNIERSKIKRRFIVFPYAVMRERILGS